MSPLTDYYLYFTPPPPLSNFSKTRTKTNLKLHISPLRASGSVGCEALVIVFSPALPLQYLSNADERLRWQANSLPSDDLCTENAIMIKRFNRYPLIIDPSGQATEFLLNEYKDRKITKTRWVWLLEGVV